MTYIYPIIAWIGAGLALFGGRRLYPFWLGFAAFLFTSRVFDILLYHLVDPLRFLGSFAAGLFVTLFVLTFRRRVLRWVLVIGGFLVMAAIAEQLLGFVYPQASKLLMGSVLVLGGLLGAFLFNRWLEFDDAVMLFYKNACSTDPSRLRQGIGSHEARLLFSRHWQALHR